MNHYARSAVALLVSVGLIGSVTPRAHAQAAFDKKDDMVKRSVVIAVVEVTAVEKAEAKGTQWTYGQRATAKVERVLKGDLPAGGTVQLHGDENFSCAQCHFAPGRYVVFLHSDGGLWAGCNWHLSVRPIGTHAEKGDVVDWYAKDEGIDLSPQPLAGVLADVAKRVEAATTAAE